MSSPELNERLARPRRFLILMSLAMIAFYALQVGVKPEAQYSGFVLTLARPDRAIYGLWIIWGWSLWRYGQKGYELLSEIWNDILEDVQAEDDRIAMARARGVGNRLAAEGHIEDLPKSARVSDHVRIEPPTTKQLNEDPEWKEAIRFRGYFPTLNGGRKYPTLMATFYWVEGGKWGTPEEGFKMELTRREVGWLRARAWIHSAIRLPALNDHIAPFVLAALALASPFFFPRADVEPPAPCYSVPMGTRCF